jgi:hypothetical protein
MEIWKTIEGYEDYQVSNLGNVKALSKHIYNGRCYYLSKEKKLKLCKGLKYYHVVLTKDRKAKTFYVHKLVVMAFLNHKPKKGYVIDHIDNNPLNNILENLQIITFRENISKDKKGCTSKYTGVSLHKTSKKWICHIRINGVKKHLGYFINEIDANNAYEKALNKILTNK